LGAEQTGINYLIIKPGKREAFAHRIATRRRSTWSWPARDESSSTTNW
jgi:hypothetical protein